MQVQLKKQLLELACEPYRPTGRFNYHWARGKLSGDPIFEALVTQSIFPHGARVLDLGCGRGLLAAWCLAAEQLAARGQWPSTLPTPPASLKDGRAHLIRSRISGTDIDLIGAPKPFVCSDAQAILWW